MAVYAAYRHIELDGIGCGKKRVMQPPGGKASGIFTESAEDLTIPSRKIRDRMASDIFGVAPTNGHTNGDVTPPKSATKSNDQTFDRLFGDENGTGPVKFVKEKPFLATTLNLGEEPKSQAQKKGVDVGNPLTGEGYTNGTNGTTEEKDVAEDAVDGKGRIPPGGYSTKLW